MTYNQPWLTKTKHRSDDDPNHRWFRPKVAMKNLSRFSIVAAIVLSPTSLLSAAPLPDCSSFIYDLGDGPMIGNFQPYCQFGGLRFSRLIFDTDGSGLSTGVGTGTGAYAFDFSRAGNTVTFSATPIGGAGWSATFQPSDFGFFGHFFALNAVINPSGPYSSISAAYGSFGYLQAGITTIDPMFVSAIRGTLAFAGYGGDQTIDNSVGSFFIPGGPTGNLVGIPADNFVFSYQYGFEMQSAYNPAFDPSLIVPGPYTPNVTFQHPAAWSMTYVMTATTTPEPTSVVLLGTGLAVIAAGSLVRRRRVRLGRQ